MKAPCRTISYICRSRSDRVTGGHETFAGREVGQLVLRWPQARNVSDETVVDAWKPPCILLVWYLTHGDRRQ
jgi:hypothetical protein